MSIIEPINLKLISYLYFVVNTKYKCKASYILFVIINYHFNYLILEYTMT